MSKDTEKPPTTIETILSLFSVRPEASGEAGYIAGLTTHLALELRSLDLERQLDALERIHRYTQEALRHAPPTTAIRDATAQVDRAIRFLEERPGWVIQPGQDVISYLRHAREMLRGAS